MIRIRDGEDDAGDGGEDGGEPNAKSTAAPLPTHLLPLTYLLQPILTVIQFYIIFILILI